MKSLILSSVAAFGILSGNALADRISFVTSQIDQFNADISAADRETKFCKMAESPFVFYRGSNHLFWADLAEDSRLSTFGGNSSTKTWLQGDLHAENYGAFHNDEGTVVYDLNDFDEAIIADYQYDVWLMATSLVLVMRQNGSISQSDQEDVVDEFTENYLDAVAGFRGNSDEIDLIYTEDNTYGKLDNFLDDVEDDESREKMLDKWTNKDADGIRQFDLAYEKLEAISSAQQNEIESAMAGYTTTLSHSFDNGYFEVKSVAKRINAGTGSLGTPRYYVLVEGSSSDQDDDLILDVKRQGKPTAYTFLDAGSRSHYDSNFYNDAYRHMKGYKALQNHVDDHLGWMELSEGFFSVRERSPYKETLDTSTLYDAEDLEKMAQQWGAILAAAHSRADKDADNELISYSFDKEVDEQTDGYHSEFRALVREIAFNYADQVEIDYAIFQNIYNPCN